ncbi:hypothetical protein EV361DRAFT_873552 [Lentinula raphanica]|nr:hypothetical protein EV361DRAFT_873552 [Lentinula raphanica]
MQLPLQKWVSLPPHLSPTPLQLYQHQSKATTAKRNARDVSNGEKFIALPASTPSKLPKVQKCVDWGQFLDFLSKANTASLSVDYMVDLGTLCSDMEAAFEELNEEAESVIENTEQYKDSLTIGAVTRQVARKIWDQTGFRFIYKSSRQHNSEKDINMFQFFCAQFDAEQARVGGSNLHADIHKQCCRSQTKADLVTGLLWSMTSKLMSVQTGHTSKISTVHLFKPDVHLNKVCSNKFRRLQQNHWLIFSSNSSATTGRVTIALILLRGRKIHCEVFTFTTNRTFTWKRIIQPLLFEAAKA